MNVVSRKRAAGGLLGTLAVAATLASFGAPRAEHQLTSQAFAATQQAAGDCAHPFVPTKPGAWRRYALNGPGDSTAVMEFRLLGVEPSQNERIATWEIVVDSNLFPKFRMEVRPRCAPNGAAESPWFGHMPGDLGFTVRGDRWRWPRALKRGARFGGTIEFLPTDRIPQQQLQRGAIVTRNHMVESPERVTVPAGSFATWRVAFTEVSSFADTTQELKGYLWVAEDVGLVKAVIQEGNRTQERVLIAYGSS